MNYIAEINEFYDWLETNQSPKAAIALWHALMHINNKARWQPVFSVAISSIESKTGFKRSELYKARNFLQQKGLIKWSERPGNLSAEYRMISFSVHQVGTNGNASGNATSNANGDAIGNHYSKLNYTKQRECPPGTISNFNSSLIYDVEAELSKNNILLEKICMAAGRRLDVALESLHKYHLHLLEHEKYPVSRKGSFAGFEKWLMNEKGYIADKARESNQQAGGAMLSALEARNLAILNSIGG